MPQIECLLVSNDSEVERIVRCVCDDLGMALEIIASTTQQAIERLRKWRFDAVIVDGTHSDVHEILRETRKARRNRTAIVLAFVQNQNSSQAFKMGANFALGKPIGMERFSRLMHAAYSLIVRQRLRYHRHNVQVEGQLSCGSVRDFAVTITNLSEGGAEIVVDGPIVISGPVHLRFVLPETDFVVEGKGEVVWSNMEGRAGIRFVPPLARGGQQLMQWLAERIHPEELGIVVKKR